MNTACALADRRGATTLEYALIVAAAAGVLVGALNPLAAAIHNFLERII